MLLCLLGSPSPIALLPTVTKIHNKEYIQDFILIIVLQEILQFLTSLCNSATRLSVSSQMPDDL